MKTKNNVAAIHAWYRIPRKILEKLARDFGVSFNTLYKTLNGNYKMNTQILENIAGYIGQGITVQDLQELSLNELNHFLYDEFMKQNSDETVVELDDLF